jgi:hypothetical protein
MLQIFQVETPSCSEQYGEGFAEKRNEFFRQLYIFSISSDSDFCREKC